MIKKIFAYLLFIIVACALSYLFVNGLRDFRRLEGESCYALEPELSDDTAPKFSLPDLDGKQRSLATWRGKTVLLHFWATWCPPCLEELPSLFKLQSELHNTNFELVTVSADDSAAIVKEFFKRHDWPLMTVLMDTSQKVPKTYGTTKYPESYLIDGDGKIIYRFVNKRDWSSREALMCLRTKI